METVCIGFTVVERELLKNGTTRFTPCSRRYHVRDAAEQFLEILKRMKPSSEFQVREDMAIEGEKAKYI